MTGCENMDEISEDMVPSAVSNYTKDYINRLAEGDTEYCYNQLDEQFQDEKAEKFFDEWYLKLKDKEIEKSSIINYRFNKTFGAGSGSNHEIGYEHEYSDSWVYFSFILQETEGKFSVVAFNLSPTENSLRQIHQFSLHDKGLLHYLFLFMVTAVPLFIIVSIGFSIKTPLEKKWLWIIFMLFGFVSFNLNWTDGTVGMQLLTFKFLGAGFSKSGIIAPWIFSFSIPFGALIFWYKRAQVLQQLKIERLIESKEKEKTRPNIT